MAAVKLLLLGISVSGLLRRCTPRHGIIQGQGYARWTKEHDKRLYRRYYSYDPKDGT